jgi:hypothetical protein
LKVFLTHIGGCVSDNFERGICGEISRRPARNWPNIRTENFAKRLDESYTAFSGSLTFDDECSCLLRC